MQLLNIGFGNMVCAERLVAVVVPESAPIKRIVQESKDRGLCIDATFGRRTRTVLITDTDHVILSALQPDTLKRRLEAREGAADAGREIIPDEVWNANAEVLEASESESDK